MGPVEKLATTRPNLAALSHANPWFTGGLLKGQQAAAGLLVNPTSLGAHGPAQNLPRRALLAAAKAAGVATKNPAVQAPSMNAPIDDSA